ncbi:MAG: hypothetical protein D6765_17615 [Bacteroidetes bacterium]|nr:MAG: hypothetical protein D6765_17615 [Bacteroidota bacterium]
MKQFVFVLWGILFTTLATAQSSTVVPQSMIQDVTAFGCSFAISDTTSQPLYRSFAPAWLFPNQPVYFQTYHQEQPGQPLTLVNHGTATNDLIVEIPKAGARFVRLFTDPPALIAITHTSPGPATIKTYGNCSTRNKIAYR